MFPFSKKNMQPHPRTPAIESQGSTLHRSGEEFSVLFHAIPSLLAITRVSDGTIVDVNEGYSKILGYSRGESIGKTTAELSIWADPKDRETFVKMLDQSGEVNDFETKLRHKDGTVIPVVDTARFITLEGEQLILSTAYDVSKLIKAKSDLVDASASRYKALVDMLPVGVYRDTAGPQGHFTEVNPFMVSMADASSAEELMKHSVSDLYSDPGERRVFAEKLMREGTVKDEELQLVSLKGRKILAAVTAIVEKGADGTVYFDGVVEDISDRKRMEEDVKESAARYKALFVSSRDAILTLAAPSWRFTSSNPAALKMFGAQDEGELLSHEPWMLSPETQPDGKPSKGKAKEMIDKAMLEGSAFFEWTHKKLDGKEFPAEVLLSKVEQNGNTFLHALVRDITERKKMEMEMKDLAEEKFRVIFQSINDGMAIADVMTHKLILANAVFSRMLGYSPDEVPNLSISDIHPEEDVTYVLDQFERQLRGEIAIAADLRVKRKDGSIFYCDVNASPVMFGGKKYLLGVFRDVTERKVAEKRESEYVAELKQMNRLMIDRELKMVELKNKIEELQSKS